MKTSLFNGQPNDNGVVRAIATICARGGSKGCPGKNTRCLHGKPLIVHSIEQALACAFIDEVFVSTDSEDIAMIAKDHGAQVPFLRPLELAGDNAGKIPVIQHLHQNIRQHHAYDCIIDLDPTSPLRNITDIERCFNHYVANNFDLLITGYLADKNPYFNMVEENAINGLVKLSKPVDGLPIKGRQQAPKVYAMNASIYIWRPDKLCSDLWSLNVGLFKMPKERSIDIDDEIDFQLVELLMEKRNEKCQEVI